MGIITDLLREGIIILVLLLFSLKVILLPRFASNMPLLAAPWSWSWISHYFELGHLVNLWVLLVINSLAQVLSQRMLNGILGTNSTSLGLLNFLEEVLRV